MTDKPETINGSPTGAEDVPDDDYNHYDDYWNADDDETVTDQE